MAKPNLLEKGLLLNVGVVVQGEKCVKIIKDLDAIKLSRLNIRLTAMAIPTDSASCHEYAEAMGIKVFENYLNLISL